MFGKLENFISLLGGPPFIPIDVAFITKEASLSPSVIFSVGQTATAFPDFSAIFSALFISRLIMIIFCALFLISERIMLFAAPPAPKTAKVFFLKEMFGRTSSMLSTKPSPSVLWPYTRLFLNSIKFTALSFCAETDKTSQY